MSSILSFLQPSSSFGVGSLIEKYLRHVPEVPHLRQERHTNLVFSPKSTRPEPSGRTKLVAALLPSHCRTTLATSPDLDYSRQRRAIP